MFKRGGNKKLRLKPKMEGWS